MNFLPILPVIPVKDLTEHDLQWYSNRPKQWTLSIVGLGDVGGTLAQALCILGSHQIREIKLFDLDVNRLSRYELELNQVLGPYNKSIIVTPTDQKGIFDADMVVFTASKAVPPVGDQVQDVRMAQLHANAELLRQFVKQGVGQGYTGFYAIVSDPVDLLCQVARDALEHYGQASGASIRVKGFGLGVMNARANYYARKLGHSEYEQSGRVYGPHGKDLIVINSLEHHFDSAVCEQLRTLTIAANLEVRALGFKPYIAPAISSAAFSIKACIEGVWHYSTIPWGRQYLGCLNAFKELPSMETLPIHPEIYNWIQQTLSIMENDYATLHPL